MRLIYVSLFNLSQYSSTEKRLLKPFNPLLGETYHLQTPEFTYNAEQVSHHPPVTACYGQANDQSYQYWTSTDV